MIYVAFLSGFAFIFLCVFAVVVDQVTTVLDGDVSVKDLAEDTKKVFGRMGAVR